MFILDAVEISYPDRIQDGWHATLNKYPHIQLSSQCNHQYSWLPAAVLHLKVINWIIYEIVTRKILAKL